MASGSTLQCADSQGSAYCFTSNHDMCVKTDGTTSGTSYQLGPPKGTMVAFTPDRMAVSGVSGSENTISLSQANNFLNFTVGINNPDPFTEVIAAPGSRITHIAYYFGKLFWWKDQSFGFLSFSNQYDLTVTIVSNQIGTLDNSSAFWNAGGFDSGVKFSGTTSTGGGAGGIYFRGQDNHIYLYDGYFLTRLTRQISPTVTAANKKKSNLWTQTSQADFAAGVSSPTVNISTSISPGDVTVSSFGITETITAFGQGSSSNVLITASGIILSTSDANVYNNSFETLDGNGKVDGFSQVGAGPYPASVTAGDGGVCSGTPVPFGGSRFLLINPNAAGLSASISLVDPVSSGTLVAVNLPFSGTSAAWTQDTLSSSGLVRKPAKLKITYTNNIFTGTLISTSSFLVDQDITFNRLGCGNGTLAEIGVDLIQHGSSTITTGWFASQAYNTGLSSSTAQLQATWTVNTSTPVVGLFTSAASNGPWALVSNSSGTNNWANQYVRYSTTFTVTSGDNALTTFGSATIVARSTGSYYSAVNNAPSLTSWNLLTIDDQQANNGTINYFTRSSTSSFTARSSTPSWVSQVSNATVASSTGTFFQLRADFAITAASQTPTLNDFTFNWTEGSAGDKAYMQYFNDAIWIAVSSGTASINNRVFYYDILNQAWLIYDVPANGFLVENNKLYFGSPSVGNVLLFGGVQTDSGTAINSYWKSKDFTGVNTNPFVQNEFQQADFIFAQSSGTVISYTYRTDQHNPVTVTLPLYDSSASLIKRGLLLARGQIGTFYNFQVGDNSGNPKWTFMAHHVAYNPLNWIPQTK